MAETCIQLFEEKYYPEIFVDAAERTILYFVEHEGRIAELWKKEWNRYLEQIAVQQRDYGAEPVAEINISFLYTSLEEGKPEFRADSYGEGGYIFKPCIASMSLPAGWLTGELAEMEACLNARAAEEGMRGIVRPAACEVMKRRALQCLLYYFAGRMKYLIREVLNPAYLAGIEKAEVFVIRFGEYMDWQKPLFAILPEVDISDCAKGTVLRFRRFPAVRWRETVFAGLDFTQAVFADCTFSRVVMEDCVLNDCIFDGCVFEQVTIKGAQMAGVLFKGCEMRDTVFSGRMSGAGMQLEEEESSGSGEGTGQRAEDDGGSEEESGLEYFEPAEFAGCSFKDVAFAGCDLCGAVVVNCEAENVEIRGGDVRDSDFRKMEGVIFRGEVQDGVL